MSGSQKIFRLLLGVTAKLKPREIDIKFEAIKTTQVLPKAKYEANGVVASDSVPPSTESPACPKNKIK